MAGHTAVDGEGGPGDLGRAGLARNSTAASNSCCRSSQPNGLCALVRALSSAGGTSAVIPLEKHPGATAFTRMPRGSRPLLGQISGQTNQTGLASGVRRLRGIGLDETQDAGDVHDQRPGPIQRPPAPGNTGRDQLMVATRSAVAHLPSRSLN